MRRDLLEWCVRALGGLLIALAGLVIAVLLIPFLAYVAFVGLGVRACRSELPEHALQCRRMAAAGA